MSLDLARARVALAREVASLEERLMGDADWLAFRDFEARTGQPMPPRLDGSLPAGLPEGVHSSLNRNPLFLARASLLEALEVLLDQEGAPQHADEPDLAARAAPPSPLDPARRIDAALAALVARAKALPAPGHELEPPDPAADTPLRGTLVPIVDETSDDLRLIAFIDDVVASSLNASGILKFSDIAHLTVDQVALISVRFGLGNRISREQWIEQAAALAAGRSTAYARMKSEEPAGLLPPAKPAAFPPRQDRPAAPSQSNTVHPISGTPPRAPLSGANLPPSAALQGEPQPEAVPPLTECEALAANIAAAAPLLPPPLVAREEPVLPPPLPEPCAELDSQFSHLDDEGTDTAFASLSDGFPEVQPEIQIVPCSRRRPASRRSGAASSRAVPWRREHDDDPRLSRSPHWEQVEEAAVEIIPRAPPFPGVGPVQEAVSRLQSAVDSPKPPFSAILKALRRR